MRDDFSEDTKRVIAARAGGHCSNPNCGAPTSGPQEDASRSLNVGVAAHITAASTGGPRFNATLSSEQRRHADNGVWLCQTCAKLVDNDEARFPEKVLSAWKLLAEHEALSSIGRIKKVAIETEVQRKVREISKHLGKHITLTQMNSGRAIMISGPKAGSSTVKLIDCTEFIVRIGEDARHLQDAWSRSIPLSNVGISWDDRHNCLELLESYG